MKLCKYNFSFLILMTFLLIFMVFISTAENILAEEKAQFYESEILVGLAELYYGSNSIEANLDAIEESDNFVKEVDMGRISFYLKGKIRGKYLITAWLDTEEQKIDEVFMNLDERKKDSPFAKIDAEKYYPVYGDDSSISSQVNTAGKLYLALESEEFKALWGNYRINYNQNQLINFSRSLYGLNIDYNDEFAVNSFYHQPFSLHSQDEMELTGGMLYYLRNDNLIAGSENISLELRDGRTNRVKESIDLKAGIDYEINYLQGRIILINKFEEKENELIAENEDKYYLIADYDYDYSYEESNNNEYGLNTYYEITDKITIGGNYLKEDSDLGEGYNLTGINLNYRGDNNKKLKIDMALSENTPAVKYISDDGGLSYEKIAFNTEGQSLAWSVDYEQKIDDYNLEGDNKIKDIEFKAYYSEKEAGFRGGNYYLKEDQKDLALSISGRYQDINALLSYDRDIEKANNLVKLKVDGQYNEKLKITSEINNSWDKKDKELKGALGFDYKVAENKNIYGSQEITIINDENNRDDITTIGGEIREDNYRIDGRVKLGRNNTVSVGAGYTLGKGSEIYTEVEKDLDSDNSLKTTVGTSSKINDNTEVFGEYRVEAEKKSNVIGIDYTPLDKWLFSVDYTKSEKDDDFKRDILSLGANYNDKAIKLSNNLEYRKDGGSEDFKQLLYRGNIQWQYNEEFSFLSEMEYIKEDKIAEKESAEASIAFAYRPIEIDRLNLIGKYSFLNKDNELTDDSDTDSFGNYAAERSQVLAIDAIYDLNPKWQLIEKVAYKNGEVKLNSVNDDWTSSETYLWVNRLNYQLREDIELFGEYRILDNSLAQDRKNGFLLGGYKRFDNNLKLGAGYNFTDFNDDLTELSYEAEGWFVNIIKAW